MAVFIAIFMLGIWLTFILPAQRANKALGESKQIAVEKQKEFQALNLQSEKDGKFYKPKYLETSQALLKQCQELLKQADAKNKIAEAERKSKKRLEFAGEAKKILNICNNKLATVSSDLAGLEKATVGARAEEKSLLNQMSILGSLHSTTSKKLENESQSYLSKYVKKMKGNIEKSVVRMAEMEKILKKDLPLVLPKENDVSKSGDPQVAYELLEKARVVLSSIVVLEKGTEQELAFQKEALEKAPESVSIAEKKVDETIRFINSVSVQNGLKPDKALKRAFFKSATAIGLLKEAKSALNNKVENGKSDLALAYGASLNASRFAKEATEEANNQIKLSKLASAQLIHLQSQIAKVSVQMLASGQYRNILNLHAKSNWTDIADNAGKANEAIGQAQAKYSKALPLVNNDQSFQSALDECNQGLNSSTHASNLLGQIKETAERLESYRSQWPSAERKAENTIDSQSSEVAEYGEYSSQAKNDFEEAKRLLENARHDANQKDFLSAVEIAIKAEGLAEGTGDKAQEAYEDSQRRSRMADDDSGSASGGGIFDSGSGSSGSSGGSFGGGSYDGGGQSSGSYGDGGGQSSGSYGDGGGYGD